MAGLQVVQTYGGEEIQIGSKEWAARIRKQAKELSGDIDTSYMKLAKILYYVHDTKSAEPPYEPLYRTWGYVSFKDYAEEELGLKDRKAEYLRKIWYRLEVELASMDSGLRKRLVALGWSKLRVLVQDDVLTILNAEQWADRAEKSSFAVLQHMVQQYKQEKKFAQTSLSGTSGTVTDIKMPEPENFYQKSFVLAEEQCEVLDAAMKKAAALIDRPDAKPSHLLTLIATDFVANNNLGNGHDARLKLIAKLEKQMGLKFVVLDPETNDVVYGVAALEAMANMAESKES